MIQIKWYLQLAPIPLLVLTAVEAAKAAATSGSIAMLRLPLEATAWFRVSIYVLTHLENGSPTTVYPMSAIQYFGHFQISLPSGKYAAIF